MQMPASMMVEPRLKFGGGELMCLPAGGVLEASSVTLLNGQGQRITKAAFGGARRPLHVVSGREREGNGTLDGWLAKWVCRWLWHRA